MEFKRLNNLTGKDPVLNRRITSIFINEFENFVAAIRDINAMQNEEEIRLFLHKLKPSLVIFEIDRLAKVYDSLLDKKFNNKLEVPTEELNTIIHESEKEIQFIKNFLESL